MKVLFKRGRRGGRLQPFVGHDEKEGRNAICAYSGRSRPPHPGLAEKEQKHNHALSGEAVYDIGLLPQRCCTFCAGYQSAVNMAVFNASQVETHFSTVFPSNKSALKSNAGALALRKTNSGFCRCRNTSQFKTYFLYRSMAFGEEGRGDTDAFSKPAHSQDSKSRCQAAFSAYSPLGDKTICRSSSVKVRPVGRLAGLRAIAEQSPGLDGGASGGLLFWHKGEHALQGRYALHRRRGFRGFP